MGYEILQSYGFCSGNQVSGHENPWVIAGYGLSQVWVKTELTVYGCFACTLCVLVCTAVLHACVCV
ncbi:hypothetical protein L208DRAFT_1342695 [Tricholoma matsutake]|nr:hypothetical protein L208DRAFT_1342695 [Tricholoma matsutake 945]